MIDKTFGEIYTAQDVTINSLETALSAKADSSSNILQATDESQALWEYQQNNTIDGIKVAEHDRQLAIDSVDTLRDVFQLYREPKAELFILDPANKEGLDAYNKVLNKVYDGEATIINESREYDAVNSRFLVYIRYDIICYKLNNRFNFLRDELI